MSTETKSAAWLHVLSTDLSAHQLLENIGVEPDQKWNLNDPIIASGKGRRLSSGLYFDSRLGDDRTVREHVHAVATRLEPARGGLLDLKRRFQSQEFHGTIRLNIWTFHPTESIEFPLDVENLAFFAGVCTSVVVTAGREPASIDAQ